MSLILSVSSKKLDIGDVYMISLLSYFICEYGNDKEKFRSNLFIYISISTGKTQVVLLMWLGCYETSVINEMLGYSYILLFSFCRIYT